MLKSSANAGVEIYATLSRLQKHSVGALAGCGNAGLRGSRIAQRLTVRPWEKSLSRQARGRVGQNICDSTLRSQHAKQAEAEIGVSQFIGSELSKEDGCRNKSYFRSIQCRRSDWI